MRIGERLRRFFAPDPNAGDVSALQKAPDQQALLDSVAYQMSPYASAMFNYGGYRYNPDELLSRKGFDIYRRMMIDEQVKAIVRFKMAAVLSRGWQLYYEDDSELPDAEQKLRIKITECGVRNMKGSFKTGLQIILSCLWQGFSLTEKEHCRYEYEGQTWIGLRALMPRPFDTFYFKIDVYGHIEDVLQRVPGRPEVSIPLNRMVYAVHNADIDSHYGQSDLREAYRSYFSKDMIIRFQNIYLERMAGGMVFLEPDVTTNIPPNSTEWLALQTLLKNMSAATGALLPRGVKANVIMPATTDAFSKAITEYNLSIAKAMLVPNLLGVTETGKTGAYSQSQTQFEAFIWTLDEIATSLEETVNEQIFGELGRANWPDGLGPSFRMMPMSDAQKNTLLATWSDLVQKGAVEASDTDEKHVRELMEFPEKGTPITKPGLIDPKTGLPMPGTRAPPQVGPDGKPVPPKVGPDGKPIVEPPKPGDQPAPLDETVVGRKELHSKHRHSRGNVVWMTPGEKRFQFELAKRQTENIEASSRRALHSAIKSGVAEMVTSLRKLGKEALVLETLEFSPQAKSAVKGAVRGAMVEAASLGVKLAQGETKGVLADQKTQVLETRLAKLEEKAEERSALTRALTKRLAGGK